MLGCKHEDGPRRYGVERVQGCADRLRNEYCHRRPHSALGYVAPARFAAQLREAGEKDAEERELGGSGDEAPPRSRTLTPTPPRATRRRSGGNEFNQLTLIQVGTGFGGRSAAGRTLAQSVQTWGVSELTYHRWRKELGGMDAEEV